MPEPKKMIPNQGKIQIEEMVRAVKLADKELRNQTYFLQPTKKF